MAPSVLSSLALRNTLRSTLHGAGVRRPATTRLNVSAPRLPRRARASTATMASSALPKVPLGSSGVMVTEVCLGTMTFGVQNSEEQAHEQVSRLLFFHHSGISCYSSKPSAYRVLFVSFCPHPAASSTVHTLYSRSHTRPPWNKQFHNHFHFHLPYVSTHHHRHHRHRTHRTHRRRHHSSTTRLKRAA